MNDDTEIDGWSISRWPTPGTLATTSMPRSRRSPAGPMPGAQQMGRRVDRPRRDDDLAPRLADAELGLLASDPRLDPDAARALEQQPLDLGFGRDRQIVAQPGARVEIADRRRDPAVVQIRDRDREIAVLECAVLVLDKREPSLFKGFGDRLGVAVPHVGKDPAHRDAAVLAVPRPVEIHVALDLFEIRQDRVPAPAGRTARLPLVVIGGRAAVGELAVDRRAAAQHPRLLVFAQRRAVLLRPVVRYDLGMHLQFGPVKARVEIGGAGIAVEDLGRHLAVRRVLASLAQQYPVGALGRQPVGHDRARRPAADDDVIVSHLLPLGRACAKPRAQPHAAPRSHDFSARMM